MSAALITPEDLAERLGVPVSTVKDWTRQFSWPHVRMGKSYRWTEQQYEEIVRRHIHVATTDDADTKPATGGLTPRSAARKRAS